MITPGLAKPRVLVVDDDPASRRLLADLVTREGYEALAAAGGAEALALLADESVDLVLLDLMMPKVDGLAVLAELKARQLLPALPVVIVTAHEERRLRIDALTAGAIDFMGKPIDRHEMACRVRTLVELRQLREQAVATVEDRLRESDRLLRLRFDQSPVAQITWDSNFCVVSWNPAAETLFGYTSAEALGKHAAFLVPEAARAHVDAVWRKVVAGKTHKSTNENVAKDGRTVQCEWHNAPLTFSDGTLMGASSVALDVSERGRLLGLLAQSQKMDAMGQLAGGVAHDFNNILAIILSYGGFIRDALPEGDQRRDDVLEVLKAAERAVVLTKQLLMFTRQQPSDKRPIDLNQSLAQLHKLLVRALGEDVALTVIPSARAAVVRIDPVQFDQIVLNLAVNARDAMPTGGQLRIALVHAPQVSTDPTDHGYVHLSVSDTGCGMDERTRQRIFEPFFTTKENGRGAGLGLATCFGIVADVGGNIEVKSVLGQGTTFTVELPLCDEEVASPAGESGRVARSGHGEIVLVAEDDVVLRRVAARVLGSAGYTVHVAADGNEAIKKLDELGPRLDVLVSDVVMPGRGGHDVAEHARRVAPAAAILLTSGFIKEAGTRPGLEDLAILWKPVRPQDLVRAVAEALRAQPARGAASGGRVLLVEDDVALSKVMVLVLANAGYSPETTASIAGARRALEAGPEPHVVLCDLSLSDGSGAELLDWIQQTRPALCPRVVVMTGGATDEAGRRVTTSGAFRVLLKPIQPRELLEAVAATVTATPELPTTAAPREPIPPPRPRVSSVPGGPPIRKERVLVVEDDERVAETCRRTLSDDFDLVVVGTVAGARAALGDSGELGALILDLGLPDGSGLDLLREFRGLCSDLPVVMMTGALSTEAATQALRSRVSEYLAKPIVPQELLRAVRSAVAEGRVSRLRTKMLAARFGGDEFVKDLGATEKSFALALPKIRMVFQPIVRAVDSSVFGYEALLRCDEPWLATPLRLFAAAEVLGRVDDVGRVVRASVAATMLAEPDRLEAIFLNVHPSEVRADLLAEVTDPLLAMAHRVILEITERASLEGGPWLDAELARIRELGYRLAVDDLGEGYAGLASLVHMSPDIAKIDMSLVRNVHRMPLKRDIVAALVDMARRSGIVVVAEGVETIDERDTLVDLGCDLLQGFLFGQPGPPFPVPRTSFKRQEELE